MQWALISTVTLICLVSCHSEDEDSLGWHSNMGVVDISNHVRKFAGGCKHRSQAAKIVSQACRDQEYIACTIYARDFPGENNLKTIEATLLAGCRKALNGEPRPAGCPSCCEEFEKLFPSSAELARLKKRMANPPAVGPDMRGVASDLRRLRENEIREASLTIVQVLEPPDSSLHSNCYVGVSGKSIRGGERLRLLPGKYDFSCSVYGDSYADHAFGAIAGGGVSGAMSLHLEAPESGALAIIGFSINGSDVSADLIVGPKN